MVVQSKLEDNIGEEAGYVCAVAAVVGLRASSGMVWGEA